MVVQQLTILQKDNFTMNVEILITIFSPKPLEHAKKLAEFIINRF